MTVAATVRKAGPTPGNSLATVFPFAFKVFVAGDLAVDLTVIATGVVTRLVLNAPLGYTVALNPDQNANPGGSITYNPAGVPMPGTQSLTISSAVPQVQGTHITNGGAFFANNIEDAVDKNTILIQDQATQIAQAIRFPIADSAALNAILPAAAQRANLVVGFDAAGNVIATSGGSNTPIAAAWQAVVQAATLALGRAAMGFSAYFDSLIVAANAAAMRVLMLIDGTSRVIKAGDMASSMMGFSLINGTLVPSQNGTQLTVAIKTLAGADPSAADPVYVLFRNVTPGTGDYTVMQLVAATSIQTTVGGTFGVANNVPFRLWLVGFNDGGVFRLAFVNCLTTVAGAGAGRDVTALNSVGLGAWGIASATQIGAGSVLSQTFYSAGAAVAAKAYATLGYITYEAGLAAAGTFGVNHSRIQLFSQHDALPGQTIQELSSTSGAVATGATVIPLDDTIPQSTEGDQYFSQAITPSSAANVLLQEVLINGSHSAAGWLIAALFQDATANAISAGLQFQTTNTAVSQIAVKHRLLALLSVATTFKVRAGSNVAGTFSLNAQSGRLLGGVLESQLQLREIMA